MPSFSYFGSDEAEQQAQPVLFLGERSVTADREALARAQAMKAAGASPEAIWRETGWMHSSGRWSYETDDRGFRQRGEMGRPPEPSLSDDPNIPDAPETAADIGNFFDYYSHPAVEQAYPAMRESLRIGGRPRGGEGTMEFIPAPSGTTDDVILRLRREDFRKRLNVPLHELQHAVDEEEGATQDIEGSARPGLSALQDPIEQRAYVAEDRMYMTPEHRRATLPRFGNSRGSPSKEWHKENDPTMRFIPEKGKRK